LGRRRRRKRAKWRRVTDTFIGFTPDGRSRLIQKVVDDSEEAEDPRSAVGEALPYLEDPEEE